MSIPCRTIYNWIKNESWGDLLQHESAGAAVERRLVLLTEKDSKTSGDLRELEKLVGILERLQRLSQQKKAAENEQTDRITPTHGKGKKKRNKKGKIKNDVSALTPEDFDKLHQRFFAYQMELYASRHQYRNRDILKSRQIGATWYFAQEAFEDACLTGDNQIFLSATRAQADVFREYIVNIAAETFDLELKGKDKLELQTQHGPSTLYFLSNNSKSAQSYHGHVYMDEYFWTRNFNELYKVATGMAAHKKWRRTRFSTPSAVTHEAYDLWTGERFQKRFKKGRQEFPGFRERQSGVLCPDNTWRKIITLKDAMAGGCDLFDLKELKLEYSPDEFRQLFMCEFIDDTLGVFRLSDLEQCPVDPGEWDDFRPGTSRPFGNSPVWGGYDPSRSRDDASFVVLAPPLRDGEKFRILERHKWLGQSFTWQAERIKELTERYHFAHLGIDTTGPGIGVFDIVQGFFPLAQPIQYSIQTKNQLVLKAKSVIEEHRLEWDARHSEIAHAFLTIRQGTTPSGQMTYSAGRTNSTGHADVAWAIMHALAHEPLNNRQSRGRVLIY